MTAAICFAWQRAKQPLEAVLLATDVGEIRQVPLSDGSKLTLDTGTSVRVKIGRDYRQALLEHGRARFTVASARTPFIIRTATAAVLLQNGLIDVSSNGAQPDLELFTGTARVETNVASGVKPLVVKAPASISTAGNSIRVVAGARTATWPSGRLSFSNARIGDVVPSANRYTKTKISIRDPSIAELRVTGVFRAGDGKGLARSLSDAFGLRLQTDASGNITLMRGAPRR